MDEKYNKIIMGIDLGYTDPTAIVIMYKAKDGDFRFHARILLTKVPYPIQVKLIDYLDTKFNPAFIGIDEGHAGIGHIQHMIMDEKLQHKDYKNRIVPIAFTSNINLGFDDDGNEIKSKMRPFSISLLQEYSNNHRISYTTKDLELVSELERMRFMRQTNGNPVYKTTSPGGGQVGEDHLTSALLCAVMAYYLNEEMLEFNNRNVSLASPSWVM